MINEIFIKKTSKTFIFSIIVAAYNVEDYIHDAINSVIGQDFGFEDNVQLIIVDDGSDDKTKDIALKYYEQYPENIIVISQENKRQAAARNLGVEFATGKYLNFLDSDDKLSSNTLTSVYNFFSKHENEVDVVSIPIMLFGRKTGNHRLNFKYKKDLVVDLNVHPNFSQLSAASSFFKKDTFKFRFDTEILVLEDTLLINKLFLEKKKYGVVKDAAYYYRQRFEENSSVDSMKSNKKYYTHRLKYFFKQLIDYALNKEGHVPCFIQYTMLYDFQWMLREPNLDILDTDEEKEEFWHYFYYVLDHISEEVILTTSFEDYTEDTKFFLLYLKNQDTKIISENNDVYLKAGEYAIDWFGRHTIWIDIVEINNNCLNISGTLNTSLPKENISFIATKNVNGTIENFKSKYISYSTSRLPTTKLGIKWMDWNNFDLQIPIDLTMNSEISIKIHYEDGNISQDIDPSAINFLSHADLSSFSHYTKRESNIILFKNQKFYVMPYSYKKILRFEFNSILKIFSQNKSYLWSGIFYRFIYLLMFPFMKNREIWLFLDRPDFADDSSKHLFKYAITQNDNIQKYFIVEKSSPDFKKLKKINKNIVPFRSMKHKFLYLFANKLIISYINTNFINPFYGCVPEYYSGLVTSKKYLFPHGVTKEDISKYIKKFNKNLTLFSTVSDIEKKSIQNDNYNYDVGVVNTLGLPRHDGLTKKQDNKQILITPSWREDLKGRNEVYIKDTNYFKRINNLFNNEKLIKMAKKYGYKLIFKPHPEIKEIIHLFDTENIIISTKETYQELINPSSLLITDYSGTFFDFAYLKKPIIYYQCDDDYHYDEGYWNYNTLGFGDVITDEDELVNRIIQYMENSCIMEDKYKKRVDNFFKFHDKNNCKRAYDWVKKH